MPRFFRPDGVARYAHDAMRLTQEVEPLCGFLCEADDSVGRHSQYFISAEK